MKIRVGITCVGSGIGQSVASSCNLSALPLHTVGFDSNPFAFGAFECDEQAVTPPIKDVAYVETLLALAREHRLDILIPGLDTELIPLAANAERFRAIGTEVLVAEEAVIRKCRDKYEFFNELNREFPAFARSYRKEEAEKGIEIGELRFPLIAKPRSGSASEGILLLEEYEQLARIPEGSIVQRILYPKKSDPGYAEYLEGIRERRVVQVSELSVQYLIGGTGRVLGRCATVNRLKSGVPVEIIPFEDSRVYEALDPVIHLLAAFGLRGPMNIQGRMTDEGPAFFELNPRFTGITGLRAAMGFNEVEAAIADFLGRDLSLPPLHLNAARIGVRQMLDKVVASDERPALAPLVERIADRRAKETQAILVTGGTGFLGRHVMDRLLASPKIGPVICVTRNPEREKTDDRTAGRIRHISWDDLLGGSVSLANIDGLIHMAFARDNTDPAEIAASLEKTRALFQLAGKHRVPRTINISSQSVYGTEAPPPWKEDDLRQPSTLYGMAKLAGELMAETLGGQGKEMRAVSLRLARLIGPGCKPYELPCRFLQAALAEEAITIEGGTQRFDLLDVRDAADAIVRLLEIRPEDWAPVYNLGSGATVGIIELADCANRIAREAGRKGAAVAVNKTDRRQIFGMDIGRIREATGWAPSIGLPDTMRDMAAIIGKQNTIDEGVRP